MSGQGFKQNVLKVLFKSSLINVAVVGSTPLSAKTLVLRIHLSFYWSYQPLLSLLSVSETTTLFDAAHFEFALWVCEL